MFRRILRQVDRPAYAGVKPSERAYVQARALLGEASCVVELSSDFPAAIELLTRADVIARGAGLEELRAPILGQRGFVKRHVGDLDGAILDITAGLSHARFAEARDETRLWLNRGAIYLDLGESELAIHDLKRCIASGGRPGVSPVLVVGARHNLGYAEYLRGELPAAITAMTEAAAEAPESQLGVLLMERAMVLIEAGLSTDAESVLLDARERLRATKMNRNVAEAELVRSRCLVDLRRYDEAALAARSAARLFARVGNRPLHLRSEVARLQARLGADREQGVSRAVALRRAGEALALATAALEVGRVGGWGVVVPARLLAAEWQIAAGDLEAAREALARMPRIARYDSLTVRVQHHVVRARLAVADGDRAGLRRAVAAGQRLLSEHRAKLGSVDAVTAAAVHGVWLGLVDVAAAERSRRPAALFDAVERGRATFAGMGRVRPPVDPVDADLLRRARAEIEAARGLETSGGDERERSARLREARRLQEEVRHRSWQAGGGLAVPVPATARQVRKALATAAPPPGPSVVNMVVLEDRVCAVVVSADGVCRVDLAPMAQIAELVRRTRTDLEVLANDFIPAPIRAVADASLSRSVARLDELLLAPLGVRGDLHIAARDLLLVVPWLSLPSRRGRRTWVNSWVDLRDRGEARRPGGVLSVAGPGLRVAEKEARAVADTWGEAVLLTGADATCEATKDALSSAGVVHLAAHGRHDTDNALFSSLRLVDGPLFAHELDGLDLRGAVVVLSACEAGLSSIRTGGEALGMTAVLLRLGVSAVIASVAPLRDDVAARVMPAFHEMLRDGATPGDALARAVADDPEPTPLVCFGPLNL